MSDDTPLCQILIPAPWQRKKGIEESSGWEREAHTTEELSTAELAALIWTTEEAKTPLSEISEEIAAQDIQRDTRLPKPEIDDEF